MTRYSRDDVLSERQLALLIQASRSLPEPRDFQARFILYAAGYLGLRAGEIAHFDTDWLDWHDRVVRIPEYDNCNDGSGDGVCGYCRSRAEDYAETNDVSMQTALDMRWEPKTETSVRSIPFDFNVWLELTIEEFDERYDRFPKSKATINRRVSEAVEHSDVTRRVYPHSLRATAATLHASRDVSPYSLMSVMGWVDLETARSYVAASDESAARELRHKHR
jgi:integrase